MREVLSILNTAILPAPEAIQAQLRAEGSALQEERLRDIADEARRELAASIVPAGVINEIGRDAFARLYPGEGHNEPDTPLERIFPRARRLALFAVTCGQAVSDRIAAIFAAHNYVLGAALDVAASLAADRAAEVAQNRFAAIVGSGPDCAGVLRYSPGSCGWHVSGQEKLFAALGPGDVDIKVTRSHLMMPLKSVSGVIVAGPAGIHEFDDDYPFCRDCDDHGCRARIEQVRAATAEGG